MSSKEKEQAFLWLCTIFRCGSHNPQHHSAFTVCPAKRRNKHSFGFAQSSIAVATIRNTWRLHYVQQRERFAQSSIAVATIRNTRRLRYVQQREGTSVPLALHNLPLR